MSRMYARLHSEAPGRPTLWNKLCMMLIDAWHLSSRPASTLSRHTAQTMAPGSEARGRPLDESSSQWAHGNEAASTWKEATMSRERLASPDALLALGFENAGLGVWEHTALPRLPKKYGYGV